MDLSSLEAYTSEQQLFFGMELFSITKLDKA